MAAAGLPDLAQPARGGLRRPALHRQHITRWLAEMALEGTHDTVALDRVVDLGIAGIDVLGELALL